MKKRELQQQLEIALKKYDELLEKYNGLDKKYNNLNEQYNNLNEKYNNLNEQYNDLDKKHQHLIEVIASAQRNRFGSKSERASEEVIGQLSLLFNEPETYAYLESIKEKTTEVAAHSRTQKDRKFLLDKLPSNIPVEVTDHRLSDDELLCPKCGCELVEIGKETVRTVDIIPAQISIHEDNYYTYACKSCEKQTDETVIVETPRVPTVYPGSYASKKSIAYLMNEKYTMGSPLYRIEQDCKRKGIDLSRQTMSNWMIHASKEWLTPIYDELHRMLMEKDIIHADETVLQVLHEVNRPAQSKSYMWLYRTPKCEEHAIVLYEYCDGRGHQHPEEFLKDFKGKYLHSDGYAAYNNIDVIHVGCLAHLKRKFHEAVEVLPKDKRTGAAVEGEAYCTKLFNLEKSYIEQNLSYEERFKRRQEEAKPIFDEFLAWGNSKIASSKSKLGVALTYLHNQGEKIRNYLLDGRLSISNNAAENAIRPFTVGRKNWLFSDTPKGAKASAAVYSLVETAKANGLNVYAYLQHVLLNMPDTNWRKNPTSLEDLMPWSPEVQEECKKK